LLDKNGLVAPTAKNDFPVCWTEDSWNDDGKKRVDGVASDAFALIAALQPYKIASTDERSRHLLYVLNRLWNDDKHKIVLPVALSASSTVRVQTSDPDFYVKDKSIPTPRLPGEEWFTHFAWTAHGPLEDDAVLVTVTKGDMLMDANLAPLVAFDPAGPGHGEEVHGLLYAAADFIKAVVERDFAPLLA
jgi:hypothetical protein